jgi:hypothetical protein
LCLNGWMSVLEKLLNQFKVLSVGGDSMGSVLVGVRAADLFHGFRYHRFSTTT